MEKSEKKAETQKETSPLIYLKRSVERNGDFLHEWKRLSKEDQKELREWAKEELE